MISHPLATLIYNHAGIVIDSKFNASQCLALTTPGNSRKKKHFWTLRKYVAPKIFISNALIADGAEPAEARVVVTVFELDREVSIHPWPSPKCSVAFADFFTFYVGFVNGLHTNNLSQ